jgi:hypothetical protein
MSTSRAISEVAAVNVPLHDDARRQPSSSM